MTRNRPRHPASARPQAQKKPVPALPAAIWRKIIAEMPSVADKAVLCSLSLVSSTLRQVAQAQLFAAITMSDRRDEQWMALFTLLAGNHMAKPRAKEKNPPRDEVDGPDFHGKGSWSGWDIMDDMTYRMMKTIEKKRELGKLVKKIYFTGIADGNASYAAMRKILELCPEVEAIHVLAMVQPRDDHQRQAKEGSFMPRVTLAVVEVNPKSLRELALISYGPAETLKAAMDLVHLPSLESLAFDPKSFAPQLVKFPPLKCQLTSFYTQSPYAHWLLPFCTTNSAETLKTLRIDLREDPVDLAPYKNLTKLEVGFKYREILKIAMRSLPRDPESKLRSLTLAKARMGKEEAIEEDFHRVAWDTIFFGIPESIEELIIEYPLSRDGFGTYFGLKTGLSGGVWTKLKSVDLRLWEREGEGGGSEEDYNVGSSESGLDPEEEEEEEGSDDDDDSDQEDGSGSEDFDDEESEDALSEEGEEALEAELRIAEQLLEDVALSETASSEADGESRRDGDSINDDGDQELTDDEDEAGSEPESVISWEEEKKTAQKLYRLYPKFMRMEKMKRTLDLVCKEKGIQLHWDRYN